jgi:Tfp pilus assembly protein FimT
MKEKKLTQDACWNSYTLVEVIMGMKIIVVMASIGWNNIHFKGFQLILPMWWS